MKQLITLIFVLSGVFLLNAELLKLNHTTINVCDTASHEIVYIHVAEDPVLEEREAKYEMLSIGSHHRFYGGYENYQMDSIFMADPDFNPPFEEFMKFSRNFDEVKDCLVIDDTSGEITYFGRIFINYFKYTEPAPEIEWSLEEGVDTVMGYECHKATASWRGREWTAWYSDIPVDGGPWKFRGLPGLILKLRDKTGEHYFEAIGTKDDVYPFGPRDSLFSRTTREKYNSALKEYCESPGDVILNSGMVESSPEEAERIRSNRLFFSPIELQ